MKNMMKYLQIVLLIAILFCNHLFAAEFDGGIDEYGNVIVSPTLALRCSISSKEPNITTDCIKRLAYDSKSGKLLNKEFANYAEERDAIVKDYIKPNFEKFAKILVDSANYEDRINALVCIDATAEGCANPANDVNTELSYNNKLALDNSKTMIDAIKARISTIQVFNITNILDNIVPYTKVDIEKDSYLAGPPSDNNSASTDGE